MKCGGEIDDDDDDINKKDNDFMIEFNVIVLRVINNKNENENEHLPNRLSIQNEQKNNDCQIFYQFDYAILLFCFICFF